MRRFLRNRTTQRLAAAGLAVLGFGTWGVVSAVSSHADDEGFTLPDVRCFEENAEVLADALYLHVEWCVQYHDGKPGTDSIDLRVKEDKTECLGPSSLPTCTELNIHNKGGIWYDGVPAYYIDVVWPASAQLTEQKKTVVVTIHGVTVTDYDPPPTQN
jgi:hypothetical protein